MLGKKEVEAKRVRNRGKVGSIVYSSCVGEALMELGTFF